MRIYTINILGSIPVTDIDIFSFYFIPGITSFSAQFAISLYQLQYLGTSGMKVSGMDSSFVMRSGTPSPLTQHGV